MLTRPRPTQEATAVPDEVPVLELVHPLPGFPDLRRFALVRLGEQSAVCDLRSLESPGVRFVVVPPAELFAGYAPEIGDDVVEALGVETAEDVVVLGLVTLGPTPEEATVNLRAPLVVNHRNRRAVQVILDDPDLPLKARLDGRGDSGPATS